MNEMNRQEAETVGGGPCSSMWCETQAAMTAGGSRTLTPFHPPTRSWPRRARRRPTFSPKLVPRCCAWRRSGPPTPQTRWLPRCMGSAWETRRRRNTPARCLGGGQGSVGCVVRLVWGSGHFCSQLGMRAWVACAGSRLLPSCLPLPARNCPLTMWAPPALPHRPPAAPPPTRAAATAWPSPAQAACWPAEVLIRL